MALTFLYPFFEPFKMFSTNFQAGLGLIVPRHGSAGGSSAFPVLPVHTARISPTLSPSFPCPQHCATPKDSLSPSHPTLPVAVNGPASPGLFFSFLSFQGFPQLLILLEVFGAPSPLPCSVSLSELCPSLSQVCAVKAELIYRDECLLGTFLPSLSPGCPQPGLAWPSLALTASFILAAPLGTCPRASLCSQGLEMALGQQDRGNRG